jgi:hypothetical protein
MAGASQLGSLLTAKIVNDLTPEGQAMNRQAKEDIEKLKRNEFGPGRAEQERMVQDALSMARAQAQAARADVQRQQAAQGYQSGTQGLATQRITEQASKQAGQLRMGAADTAAQLAAKARAEALGRIKQRSDQTVADVKSIRDEAHAAYMGSGGAQAGGGADYTKLMGAYGGKSA